MDNAAQARSENGDRPRPGQSGEQYEPRMQQGSYYDRRYEPPKFNSQPFRSNPNTSTPQERYEQFDAQRRLDAGIGYPDPYLYQMQRDQGYPGTGNSYPRNGNPGYDHRAPPYIGYSTGYAGREHIDIDPVMLERFQRAAREMGGDAFRWFNENFRVVPRDEPRGFSAYGREAYGSDGGRVHRYAISLKR